MDPKSLKSAIRREVVARIAAMDPSNRRAQERALEARFEALSGYESAESVLLYCSAFVEEFDTFPLLRKTLDLGKRLILPTVDRAGRCLRLFEVADLGRDLKTSRRGIPEPVPGCPEVSPFDVDWVLVPGLAFDDGAWRLGRGAGHYDRLLPQLRPDAPRWAMVLDVQWVPGVPVEPHDQPLDGVVDQSRMVLGHRGIPPRWALSDHSTRTWGGAS